MEFNRKVKTTKLLLVLLLMTQLVYATAHATVPKMMNYQGYLTNPAGTPVGGGGSQNVSILFSVYNTASGGTALWSETRLVSVTDGIFSAELNLSTASPALDFDEDYYLGIKVGTDAEMTPRQILGSVAYAMRAEHANNVAAGAIQTASLADSAVTGLKIQNSSITASDIANNAVTAMEIATNAVTASEIATGAVGATEIGANAVTESKIGNGAVTSSKIAVPLSLSRNLEGALINATNGHSYGTAVSGNASGTGSILNYGGNFSASGDHGIGVSGYASGASGDGVRGTAIGTTGNGGFFEAGGTSGKGVLGRGFNTSAATNYGGYFEASGTQGRGVYGAASGTHGRGVYGSASGTSGRGVYGSASGTSNVNVTNYGGYFIATGEYGRGVYGEAPGTSGRGVHGEAYGTSGRGVYGYGSSGWAGYFDGNVYVNGTLSASNKQFIHPHPDDPSKEIVYVSLEGGENGVYVRGNGQLENGRQEVVLPDHFSLVAAVEGLTVQITPRDGKAKGYLFVEKLSPEKFLVLESNGGTSKARFDYLVNGVRLGYEEHEVIRENKHSKPDTEMSQEEYEDFMALDKRRSMQKLLTQNGTLTAEGKINQATATRLGWKMGPKTKAERMK